MTTRDRIVNAVLLLAFFGLFALSKAQAQTTRVTLCNAATPNNAVCLSWGAVVARTDGLPTTFPVTYRAEQQTGTGNFVPLSTVSATQLYVQNLAPGSYTFRVYAIENSVVSAASNSASRTITQSPPNAPVIVIAVVIGLDHSPVYRLTSTGKKDARYSDACGYIPVGSQCKGNVAFSFRDKSFRAVNITDVKQWADCGTSVAAPCG